MDQKWGMDMAYGVVDDTQQLNMGIGRKKEMEIACECWFTSKGKMQPLMFKYQDEHGGDPYYKRDTGTFQRRKKSYGVPLIRNLA